MKTDKQIYRLFQANPGWLFELTGLDAPGPCTLRSFTVKALQRDADGLVVPDDPLQPLTVLEFQFRDDPAIYTRIVEEMVTAQVEFGMRRVRGVILFRYPHLDPRTEPWTQVVQAFVLRDVLAELAKARPDHPLVAVFQPVLLSNEQTLQRNAVQYYRQITRTQLPAPQKTILVEVFLSWLEQRLPHMSKKQIEEMFVGELPDLEETQSGKDLIAIGEKRGEKRGKAEGLAEAIMTVLASRQVSVPAGLRQRLRALSLPQLQELLPQACQGMTLVQLKAWLAKQAAS